MPFRAPLAAFLLTFAATCTAHFGQCWNFAADLRKTAKIDQTMRLHLQREADASGNPPSRTFDQVMLIDRVHIRRVKQLLADCCWPRKSIHGMDAVRDAWLLVQHADQDLRFQRAALTMMKQAVEEGEVPGDLFAYLSDRVSIARGRPQPYGTQVEVKDGCTLSFLPIEALHRVEANRKAMGLPSLDDYRREAQRHLLPGNCK